MAVSVRKLKAEFPEFRDTDPVLIQRAIRDATLQIESSVWGAKADAGISYLAADIITSGPHGEQARLKKDSNVTTYKDHYERLKRQVTVGLGRTT